MNFNNFFLFMIVKLILIVVLLKGFNRSDIEKYYENKTENKKQ